jgi:hypothetical protein
MRYALLLLALLSLLAAPTATAAETPAVTDRTPSIEFPNRITFRADVAAAAGLHEVSLEYGVDRLTCGEVVARSFPQVEQGATSAAVEWTWDMRQSGSLPPGARIWYRWHVTDTAGATSATERQEIVWLDDLNPWRALERGAVTLHWYEGSRAYAEDLLATADTALARLSRDIGVQPRDQVHLYIYPDTEAMREAVLYEAHWTGGLAYPVHSIVIIGIHPEDAEWGRRTVAHEISHVLVGHRTFSCLGSTPSWLDEGLAMYSEGEPDEVQEAALARAVAEDRLLPLRGLGGAFSEDSELANLSYAQSHSVVRFLLGTYGRDRLLALLDSLSHGTPVDDALRAAYDIDLDTLEDRWRDSLGVAPLRDARQAPTPTPQPTPVPTFVPAQPPVSVAALPTSVAPEAAIDPEAAIIPEVAAPAPAAGPSRVVLLLGVLLLGVPLAVAAGVGLLILGTRKRS